MDLFDLETHLGVIGHSLTRDYITGISLFELQVHTH